MPRPPTACMAMTSLSAAVLIVACSGSSHGSSGGSCAALSPAGYFARARVVFVGTMLTGRTADVGGGSVLISPARVRVTRYLKGGGPGVVTVATGVASGSVVNEDGIEPQTGQPWKIYTLSRRMPYQTSICDGSSGDSNGSTRLAHWAHHHYRPWRGRRLSAGAGPRTDKEAVTLSRASHRLAVPYRTHADGLDNSRTLTCGYGF